jgi:hypothetical protein
VLLGCGFYTALCGEKRGCDCGFCCGVCRLCGRPGLRNFSPSFTKNQKFWTVRIVAGEPYFRISGEGISFSSLLSWRFHCPTVPKKTDEKICPVRFGSVATVHGVLVRIRTGLAKKEYFLLFPFLK